VLRSLIVALNKTGESFIDATGWTLQTDALSAIVFVVVALFVLPKINAARAQGLAEDDSRVG
jgi:hypothetical protein